MPLKTGKLTQQERRFAAEYAKTGDRERSARAAGYASPSGPSQALQRPAVVALVDELYTGELVGEILPLALKRHRQILADPKSTGPMLSKAIDTAYKYGFAKRDTTSDKELHEMSWEELQQIIKASDVARLIEGEVVEPAAPDPIEAEFG